MPQNMISDTSPKLDGSMKLFYIPFNCFMVKCAYSKFTWKLTGKSADTVIKILWLNVHIYISYHCVQFNAHFLPYFGKYICVVLAWNMKHNNILNIKIANFHVCFQFHCLWMMIIYIICFSYNIYDSLYTPFPS
jgi:hypothetical protein